MNSRSTSYSVLVLGVVAYIAGLLGIWNSLYGVATNIALAVFGDSRMWVQQAQQVGDLWNGLEITKAQNEQLRNDISVLRLKLHEQEQQQAMLRWVEGQVKLMKTLPAKTWGVAQVLQIEVLPVPGYIYIQSVRGELAIGDYLVANGVIVGEVVVDYGSVFKVRLFTAADSQVAVMVRRKAIGNLVGNGTNSPVMENVNKGEVVATNAPIYLLNPVTPAAKTIPVGFVAGEITRPVDAQQSLQIEVPADIKELDYLFILKQHAY